MLRALKDMAKNNVNSVMFGGEGEPTLHKDLGLFIQKAKEYGLDIALTTNGTLFNKEIQEQCLPHLSWIKFSVDAGTPETYSKIHGVPKEHFDSLLKNISDSIELKRKNGLNVTIGIQFLMVRGIDKSEVINLIEMLKKINPDYLSIKPYSDHPRSRKDLIVDTVTYNEFEETLEGLKLKINFEIFFRRETIERIQEGNKYPECYGLSFISLIDSKGNVLPCNLFYGVDEFTYGNLYKKSFSEIWESDKRKDVLAKLRYKGVGDCRRGCRCDAGNRYLDRLKNPEAHDNFT